MFRNRGNIPNVEGNTEDEGYNVPHYTHYWNRRYIIIKYDWKFVAIEVLLSLLIILPTIAVYLFAYNVSFVDPIASTKSTFLNIQLISIGGALIATGLVTFLSSSKETIIKSLRILAIVSVLTIFVLIVTKLCIDNMYNEETFGKFYELYEEQNNTSEDEKKISFGLSEMKMINSKKIYIDESVKAYTNFSVKVTLLMIIHVLIVIILLYLSHKLSSKEREKEKVLKDDKVLFDEEQNIRF